MAAVRMRIALIHQTWVHKHDVRGSEGRKTHAVSPYMGLMPPASRPVINLCIRTARPAECGFVGWTSQGQGQGTSL